MTKQIAWEKWHNPYGDEDGKLDKFKELFSTEDVESDTLEYQDSYGDQDNNEERREMSMIEAGQMKVMSTPMGIIPITEHTDANKIFNFWVGHANFNLSPKVIGVISNIDGVETLDIFTRYRMRIGIGKHPSFKDRDILHRINTAVSGITPNE